MELNSFAENAQVTVSRQSEQHTDTLRGERRGHGVGCDARRMPVATDGDDDGFCLLIQVHDIYEYLMQRCYIFVV
jgi:hypothetical protein